MLTCPSCGHSFWVEHPEEPFITYEKPDAESITVMTQKEVADRMVAGDAADNLICCAMVLFSIYSGRGIYLDIALVGAMLGILDTMLVGRYLEGRL